MGVFASNDGEGGTFAERVALIGILCFAFAWIPIFIAWKVISVCRERHRSPEQELEAGNLPVTTNPPKPKRKSFRPGIPHSTHHSSSVQGSVSEFEPTGMDDLSHITAPRKPQATVTRARQQEHRRKRKPMPTQPAEPRMRRLPDTTVIDYRTR